MVGTKSIRPIMSFCTYSSNKKLPHYIETDTPAASTPKTGVQSTADSGMSHRGFDPIFRDRPKKNFLKSCSRVDDIPPE